MGRTLPSIMLSANQTERSRQNQLDDAQRGSMFQYTVFGGVLSSPFDFPGLPLPDVRSERPTWSVEVDNTDESAQGELIGKDSVYGEVHVNCYRTSEGHALDYDDTGRFEVSCSGSRIVWRQPSDPITPDLLEAGRADLLGRVIALALHQQGVLSLHASAIQFGNQGIALLAPKGHGKSTLATALVNAGGQLLSDDTVPVKPGDSAELCPGVPQLRLWRDSALHLANERAAGAESSRKLVLDDLPQQSVSPSPVPFAAGYFLVPVKNGESVSRQPLDQIQSALGLIEHSKIGALLGRRDAALVFEQAAAIAQKVPFYILRVRRDLGRIGEVAATIRSWHQTF